MGELTEKEILAMMAAAEEEQLNNPPSEPVRPMESWKMEDPIGLIEVDGKEIINIESVTEEQEGERRQIEHQKPERQESKDQPEADNNELKTQSNE